MCIGQFDEAPHQLRPLRLRTDRIEERDPAVGRAWHTSEMTSPVRENSKLLSPINASIAALRSWLRMICAALDSSLTEGAVTRPDAVRNNCHSEIPNARIEAPSSARSARDACASNSNCHQISRL